MPLRRTHSQALLLALAAAICAERAFAEPAKTATAHKVSRAPVIDGRLDDPAWRDAHFVSDFHQLEPVELGEPSQRTEVAFAYDREALYVAARMFIAGPDDLEAVMTRRDDTGVAERIIVSFDTFLDQRTAYSFAVTAGGVRADWIHPDDATFPRDATFNPVWEAEVDIEEDRWLAEMRIPFSQLRFPERREVRWGLNINRYIPHRNEDIFWIVVPKGETGWSSYFGELRGMEAVTPSRRFELLPYVAGDMTLTSSELVAPQDPFSEELGFGGRAGLDAKLGIGPSLTLDATFNPDFGQVEADPAVVNLTAFEAVFEERRPFFIEGANLLAGGGSQYYYSRRIGAPPRGRTMADFAAAPDATRILGAGKLTGRLPSRLKVGALTAVTQRTAAGTVDLTTGERSKVPVEPLTSYNLLRVEQELGAHASRIGATLAGVYRRLDDPVLEDQFHRHATTGGADWNLRFSKARYEIGGDVGFSAVGGTPEAIAATQRSSTHYFQRPDQDHVTLSPDRTSLYGWTAGLYGGKRSGAWRYGVAMGAESPGFELNDMGLLLATDDLGASGNVRYFDTDPTELYHAWDLGLDVGDEWNFGGDRDPGFANLSGGITLPNFWRFDASGQLLVPGTDDRATRGGPLTGVGWGQSGGLSVSNSFGARHRFTASMSLQDHQTGPSGVSGSLAFTTRPIDRIELSLTPSYSALDDNRQYVTTITGAGGPTFGARYLFAEIERRELRLQTRLQLALTPELVVELYAEPFASSGAFSRFGELPEAGSRELRIYGEEGATIEEMDGTYTVTDGADTFSFESPDFSVLSLRSTMVLRWEFLPGSTLFFVWQQNRGEDLARLQRATPASLGDTFATPGRHTLALKLSYWWSP